MLASCLSNKFPSGNWRILKQVSALPSGVTTTNNGSRRCVNNLSAEPFMSGSSATYIEEMYYSWMQNPDSVHKSWDVYFRNVQAGLPTGQAYTSPPNLNIQVGSIGPASTSGTAVGLSSTMMREQFAVQEIIRNYQQRGHNIADLDPLGILDADLDGSTPLELELATHGFTENDLDREFYLPHGSTFIGGTQDKLPLREIINRLKVGE